MTELAETELISPLLDGFAMGNPMSSHDGVRCCPAIKENSDEKYIVKIISVPAAQTQMMRCFWLAPIRTWRAPWTTSRA